MTAVRYHPAARLELRAAVQHGEAERAGRGALLEAAISEVLRRIRRLPRSAPRWPGTRTAEVRRAVVNHQPYLVVYALVLDQIVIVAIAHTRRMPGYWHDRVAGLEP